MKQFLRTFLEIKRNINKIEYRKRKEAIEGVIPFYNTYVHNTLKIIKYLLIFLFVNSIVIIFKAYSYKWSYIIGFINILILVNAFFSEGNIGAQEEKHNTLSFFYSGIFSHTELKQISGVYKIYLFIVNVGIYVEVLIYLYIVNFFMFHEGFFVLLIESCLCVLLYIIFLCKNYKKYVEEKFKMIAYRKTVSGIKIVFLLGSIILFKLRVLKIENIKDLIGDVVKNIKDWHNAGYIAFILLIIIVINILTYKRGLSIRANYYTKNSVLSGIQKQFYYDEVKNKISFGLFISSAMLILGYNDIDSVLIISIIMMFLFSIYNNRFLLNCRFENYYNLVNKRNIFFKISKDTCMFTLTAIVVSITIVSDADNIIYNLCVAVLMLIQNYIIHSYIYIHGYSIPSEKKLQNIEIMSGLYYVLQIVLITVI